MIDGFIVLQTNNLYQIHPLGFYYVLIALFVVAVRKERAELFALGIAEHFFRSALFFDDAVCHKDHLIRDVTGKLHFVRYDDHGRIGVL